ncbi:MAG: MBL fold metallo-hydrolase, partial [Elusimicrobia bacterium]|nr:MBL fold metallo-hydrolase [Elusimicrobiota bacterium]
MTIQFRALLFLTFVSFLFFRSPDLVLARAAKELTVTFLDCGQGDAIVIRTPKGKTYLVDTGPNDTLFGGWYDAGRESVVPFLESLGVQAIDTLLITHPHLDHYGGTIAVLEKFRVAGWMGSGIVARAPPYLDILNRLQQKQIPFHAVQENDSFKWDSRVKVKVLNPNLDPAFRNSRKEDTNNQSVVLKLTYRKVSFLLSGDVESDSETRLTQKYGKKLKSQILKAAHHGSRTSSSLQFLKAVNPEILVISCGRNNSYSHPHPQTLDRFRQLGIEVYRTDLDG